MELFTRPSNEESYLVYKQNIEKQFNITNFLSFSKFKIKKLFCIGQEENFLRYRFELIKAWMKQNLMYTTDCINKLDLIFKKMMINSILYPEEEAFIYSIRNIVFAKKRNLKSVLTDLKTPKNEVIYYFYQLNKYLKDDQENIGYQVCLSNFNIYLRSDKQKQEKIDYKDIHNLHLCNDSLVIQTTMNKYQAFVSEPKLLYVSLERILKIKKIL